MKQNNSGNCAGCGENIPGGPIEEMHLEEIPHNTMCVCGRCETINIYRGGWRKLDDDLIDEIQAMEPENMEPIAKALFMARKIIGGIDKAAETLSKGRTQTTKTGPKKMDRLFMFTMIDQNGDEGVIGQYDHKQKIYMPFIAADEERVRALLPEALSISAGKNKPFKILEFTNIQDITHKYIEQ